MSSNRYPTPLLKKQADPWIYKHLDGYYYFTASSPEFDRIDLRRAKTIEGLRAADSITIWEKHESGPMSELIWAPEIHYISGKWYVYFAAAATKDPHPEHNTFQHRMYVLENGHANPLEGEWAEKGQVKTLWETFALDATVFEHDEKIYYVWAQKEPNIAGHSNLYISEMENPWTLKGPQILLTKPEFPWEKIGFLVNEGPAVLKRNGKIFITYSASATDENYSIGLLVADADSNLLDRTSWEKSKTPVFRTCEENKKYGPGHNSFTVSEDGTEDILVYHVRDQKNDEDTEDALHDAGRHACVQAFEYDKYGYPKFGQPVRNNSELKKLRRCENEKL